MNASAHLPLIADRFKRSVISDTANHLHAAHGRRKMYSASEVMAAVEAAHFPAAWAGWAVAVFCTGAEFADYCRKQNISADYEATRAEALKFIDKPEPQEAGKLATGAVAAGAVAIAATSGVAMAATSGVAMAATGDSEDGKSTLGVVGDVLSTGADVVGGLFDILSIFD